MSDSGKLTHATVVARAGAGVLIQGASGAGKSDLALRLIATPLTGLHPHTFSLVADDQVLLSRADNGVMAHAPDTIAGRLEVRGLGIVSLPALQAIRIELIVGLAAAHEIERMPKTGRAEILGVKIPMIRLYPFEPSAPAKVALALNRVCGCQPPG
ncbi:MAG: HPr kinase/phosphatase C-terminal domain-containing protein [Hyphomicrobiaceae bacterium]|nr:HPr kinase/phosphatase C-terminal domain-containing protein [Hyphomicrobiaceae bacterium]